MIKCVMCALQCVNVCNLYIVETAGVCGRVESIVGSTLYRAFTAISRQRSFVLSVNMSPDSTSLVFRDYS